MIGNDRIIELLGLFTGSITFEPVKILHHAHHRTNFGGCKFPPDQTRQTITNNTRNQRKYQVKRANILVVGGHEPTLEETRLVVVIVMCVVEGNFIHRHEANLSIELVSSRQARKVLVRVGARNPQSSGVEITRLHNIEPSIVFFL